jgi:hypothetical protein
MFFINNLIKKTFFANIFNCFTKNVAKTFLLSNIIKNVLQRFLIILIENVAKTFFNYFNRKRCKNVF